MTPIAAAAAEGDLMRLTLIIAGSTIVVAFSLIWWLIKERMHLNKERLKAGIERMNGLQGKDEQQDESINAICTNYVHKNDCDKERKDQDRAREKMERSVDKMVEHQGCIDIKIGTLGVKVDERMETITGMLSRLVDVPKKNPTKETT